MPVRHEVVVALREYDEKRDLALDWLLKSFRSKDEDREIARFHYKKILKEASKILKRMNKIIKEKGLMTDGKK